MKNTVDFKDVPIDETFYYKEQKWQKYDENSAILSDPLQFEPHASVLIITEDEEGNC